MAKQAAEAEQNTDDLMAAALEDPLTGERFTADGSLIPDKGMGGAQDDDVESGESRQGGREEKLTEVKLGKKTFKVDAEIANALAASRGSQSEKDRLAADLKAMREELAEIKAGRQGDRGRREAPEEPAIDERKVAAAIARAEQALETKGEVSEALTIHGEYLAQEMRKQIVKEWVIPVATELEELRELFKEVSSTTAPLTQVNEIDRMLTELGLDLEAREIWALAREKEKAGMAWGTAVYASALELDREGRGGGGGETKDEEREEPVRRPPPGGSGQRPGARSLSPSSDDLEFDGGRIPVGSLNANTRARLFLQGKLK